jgi:hypothetical protein
VVCDDLNVFPGNRTRGINRLHRACHVFCHPPFLWYLSLPRSSFAEPTGRSEGGVCSSDDVGTGCAPAKSGQRTADSG